MLEEGEIINKKWVLGKFLDEGAFGKVYEISPLKGILEYDTVAKIIRLTKQNVAEANSLFYEYTLINGHLNAFPFRPRVPLNFYGEDKILNIRYLILEKLDINLYNYFKELDYDDRPLQAAKYGLDILEGLKWLHEKKILFIDIKPENFMLAASGGSYKLYFIDFGLVKLLSQSTAGNIGGTPQFLSLNVNKGNKCKPIDEIESLGYMLLFLCTRGRMKLPWSEAKSNEEMIELKTESDIEALAEKRNCDEIADMIYYIRDEQKDYSEKFLKRMKGRLS